MTPTSTLLVRPASAGDARKVMRLAALDGAVPPDADLNDDHERWCADEREGPPTEIGLPGSPGEANPPCP